MTHADYDKLHPATKRSIEAMDLRACDPKDKMCGCFQHGKWWWLCQFHDGFENGVTAREEPRHPTADQVVDIWRDVCASGANITLADVRTVLAVREAVLSGGQR